MSVSVVKLETGIAPMLNEQSFSSMLRFRKIQKLFALNMVRIILIIVIALMIGQGIWYWAQSSHVSVFKFLLDHWLVIGLAAMIPISIVLIIFEK